MPDATKLRWEWRTFGDGVSVVETHLRGVAPEERRSRDTYIVSDRSDINTKIRDGLLDIKTLDRVDAHGLELWKPAAKLHFPLSPASVEAVLRLWGVSARPVGDHEWPLDALLDRIVARDSALARVDVEKLRRIFAVDDCLVEVADLTIEGQPLRTAAVEMFDPERVWHTVQTLGLSSYENVNYVKALKRVLAVHST